MTTCSPRFARTALATLTLVIVFAGLSLAQEAPMTANLLPGKNYTPIMSVGASQPDLNPLGLTTPEPSPKSCPYPTPPYGTYDEWRKDGEVCRTRHTCLPPAQQYWGSCPNGWDEKTTEVVPCSC
jgi:hypothetical protein